MRILIVVGILNTHRQGFGYIGVGIMSRDESNFKPFHSRQWLMRKYLEEELSMRQIACICDVKFGTIHYWMIKFGIPRRPRGKSGREKIKTKDIHICLSEDLFLSLTKLSENKETSISNLASEALRDYMLKNKYNPFLMRNFKDKNV